MEACTSQLLLQRSLKIALVHQHSIHTICTSKKAGESSHFSKCRHRADLVYSIVHLTLSRKLSTKLIGTVAELLHFTRLHKSKRVYKKGRRKRTSQCYNRSQRRKMTLLRRKLTESKLIKIIYSEKSSWSLLMTSWQTISSPTPRRRTMQRTSSTHTSEHSLI